MDFPLVPRGTDRNYTGFLTKTIVYTGTLVVFLACKRQLRRPDLDQATVKLGMLTTQRSG